MRGTPGEGNAALQDIERSHLLDGLALPGRRFVALYAAAGFGKTTLALQLADRFARTMVCDLAKVSDVTDVMSRIAALFSEAPSARISGAESVELSAYVDYALERWTQDFAGLVVFENAETLIMIPGAVEALVSIFATTPQNRAVCLCSRARLDISFLQFARPDEVLVLDETTLAFTTAELESLFSSSEDIAKLYDVTRGWPLCVRLVGRLAEHRTLAEVLSEIRGVEYSMLYDFLVEHVVRALDPGGRRLAVLLAGTEDLLPADLARLLGEESASAAAFLDRSPFVTFIDGRYALHPLVRQSILRTSAEEAGEAAREAAHTARDRDPLRAAVLYARVGDVESAASALEELVLAFVVEPKSIEFVSVLERIPRETLLRYPRLFGASITFAGLSVSNEQRLRDALAVEANLPSDSSAVMRGSIGITIANALANLGRLEEALAVAQRAREWMSDEATDASAIYYYFFVPGIQGRMGRYAVAAEAWPRLKHLAHNAPSSLALGGNECWVRSARARGDWDEERRAIAFTLQQARESKNPTALALTLAEGLFSAWLHGDRRDFAELLVELNELRVPAILPGTRLLRDMVNARFDDLSPDVGRPQLQAYAYLIGLSFCRGKKQYEISLHAEEAARRSGEPFLQALAAVAASFVDRQRSKAKLALAAEFAARVDALPLREAFAAFRDGTVPPMFAPMRDQVAIGSAAPNRYRLSLLEGSLHRGALELLPTRREFDLLGYLAFRDRIVSRHEFAEVFAPSSSSSDADRSLRVAISRIRKKFGNELIVSTPQGYALGHSVQVPLREIRERVALGATHRKISHAEVVDLQADLAPLKHFLETEPPSMNGPSISKRR